MNFRIADTFTDSLARLTGEEQKAIKTTAFDLQLNPASPGMQLHKLDKSKDKNFLSVRVSSDIRLIVHKTELSLLLCYVDHHDAAYRWAERRKLETHPTTGAAQLVEIRETVREVVVPKYVEAEVARPPKPKLFREVPEQTLLSFGVPKEWLEDVRQSDEDTLLGLVEHLPGEAAEALLNLATGTVPVLPKQLEPVSDPFAHPDALRRFRLLENVEELEQALAYPWEKWTVFLHPAQRQLAERTFNGPARVSGSAGTGKTVVALHRAVYLARRSPDARVLLATFSETLASALRTKLYRLISSDPRLGDRIEVHSLSAIGRRLHELNLGPIRLASDADVRDVLRLASTSVTGHKFSERFIYTEWCEVVDAWQMRTWEAYRDVKRLGRKTRLPEAQRRVIWAISEQAGELLRQRGLVTEASMFTVLASHFAKSKSPPFNHAVIDESQDLDVPQLRFLAALGAESANGLFFAGDLGQRIFQLPFSWQSVGVEIRGRSHSLRINYRTSHQIRQRADLLLGPEASDVDGNVEDRRGTASVFNGPPPEIRRFDSPEVECDFVADWLKGRRQDGLSLPEIAVIVRSHAQLDRAIAVCKAAKLPWRVLDENVDVSAEQVSLCTMHLAKGLEFRAVAVIACDDEILPLQERIEAIADEADLEEVYKTERHLLYVACTRARDHLLVSCGDFPSEFLRDLET